MKPRTLLPAAFYVVGCALALYGLLRYGPAPTFNPDTTGGSAANDLERLVHLVRAGIFAGLGAFLVLVGLLLRRGGHED